MDRRTFLASSAIACSHARSGVSGFEAEENRNRLQEGAARFVATSYRMMGTPKWKPTIKVPGLWVMLDAYAPGGQGPFDASVFVQANRNGKWEFLNATRDSRGEHYRATSSGRVLDYVVPREPMARLALFVPHQVIAKRPSDARLRLYVSFYKSAKEHIRSLDRALIPFSASLVEDAGEITVVVKGSTLPVQYEDIDSQLRVNVATPK